MFPMQGRSLPRRAIGIGVLVLGVTTRALAAPAQPPTAETAPAPPPSIEPLPAAETPPTAATVPPAIEPLPSAPVALEATAPAPVAPESDPPIFEKWWFWTAIAAFAVTAVVIVATSSGPSPPKTDLGNMTAF